METYPIFNLDGTSLKLQDFIDIVRFKRPVRADIDSLTKMQRSYEFVHRRTDDSYPTVYGLNTGLGSLQRIRLSQKDLNDFSRKIILSHACGVGEPFDEEITRGAMLLLANNFLSGYSGIRPSIVETIIQMINTRLHPIVPSQGSLGAFCARMDETTSASKFRIQLKGGEQEMKAWYHQPKPTQKCSSSQNVAVSQPSTSGAWSPRRSNASTAS